MSWLESHQELASHPKLFHLASLMKWEVDLALGKLHRFWYWCVDYAEDGDLRKYNDELLGYAVGLNGEDCKRFVEAMVQSGWIDRVPYFRVHDWWDWSGRWWQSKYKKKPEAWKRIRDLYYPPLPSPDLAGTGTHNTTIPNPTGTTTPLTPQGGVEHGSDGEGAKVSTDKKSPYNALMDALAENGEGIKVGSADEKEKKALSRFYARWGKLGSEILDNCRGDSQKAYDCVQSVGRRFDGLCLQWSLEAVAKQSLSWYQDPDGYEQESKRLQRERR